jgi:hypothetical protein
LAIASTDIEIRLSGGAANTTPNSALGGAMGTAAGALIATNVANNLFDDVSGSESAAGMTDYRGIYVKNNHGSLTLQSSVIYISADTTSTSTELDLGLAAEAMNVDMATIPNETTAPSGITFSHPTSRATGLQLNGSTGLTAGSRRGVWVRRTVTAGASASADGGDIKVEGDTAP